MNVRWPPHTDNGNDIGPNSTIFHSSLSHSLTHSFSELCISISLNLSSLSWPKQFDVEHKHTKELNDAMICGTVVAIQQRRLG